MKGANLRREIILSVTLEHPNGKKMHIDAVIPRRLSIEELERIEAIICQKTQAVEGCYTDNELDDFAWGYISHYLIQAMQMALEDNGTIFPNIIDAEIEEAGID